MLPTDQPFFFEFSFDLAENGIPSFREWTPITSRDEKSSRALRATVSIPGSHRLRARLGYRHREGDYVSMETTVMRAVTFKTLFRETFVLRARRRRRKQRNTSRRS